MIYNEELAKLVSSNMDLKKKDKSSEILKAERDFLKVVVSRLEDEIKKGNIINGKVHLSFVSHSYGHDDKGYTELFNLIHSGFFHSFASEYKIYFDGEVIGNNEYEDSYISLVWDYETYKKELELANYDLPTDYDKLIEERLNVEKILLEEERINKLKREEIRRKEEEARRKREEESLDIEYRRYSENRKMFQRLYRKYHGY